MKQEILNLIGNNQTKTLSLNNTTIEEVHGVYTYRGDVFCLKDGEDISFDDLTENEKNKIYKAIKAKEYIIDPTLQ